MASPNVNPARAGMIRARVSASRRVSRKPRASGDDPREEHARRNAAA